MNAAELSTGKSRGIAMATGFGAVTTRTVLPIGTDRYAMIRA